MPFGGLAMPSGILCTSCACIIDVLRGPPLSLIACPLRQAVSPAWSGAPAGAPPACSALLKCSAAEGGSPRRSRLSTLRRSADHGLLLQGSSSARGHRDVNAPHRQHHVTPPVIRKAWDSSMWARMEPPQVSLERRLAPVSLRATRLHSAHSIVPSGRLHRICPVSWSPS